MPQLTTAQPVHDIWRSSDGSRVAALFSVCMRYGMTSGEMIVETGPKAGHDEWKVGTFGRWYKADERCGRVALTLTALCP